MKELPIHFEGKGEVKGYTFTQISSSVSSYIYEVEQGGHRHYEVFKKLVRRNTFKGFDYIAYPRSTFFSVWAWTCMSLEAAKKKLLVLSKIPTFQHLQLEADIKPYPLLYAFRCKFCFLDRKH